jgi:hypothetical protein
MKGISDNHAIISEKRTPSERQLGARQVNAARIAGRISDLIASGHKVFDETGDQVLETVVGKGGDSLFGYSDYHVDSCSPAHC